MTVFVLENGSYSDTRVVGVYSTRKRADMASRVFKDDPNIFEVEVDACSDAMYRGEVPWFVRMKRDTGDVLAVEQTESSYSAFTSHVGEDIHKNLYTTCWAADRERAIKIASDRRAIFLATPQAQ